MSANSRTQLLTLCLAGGAAVGLSFYFSRRLHCPMPGRGYPTLKTDEFTAFPIDSIEQVNHNTRIFRFRISPTAPPLPITSFLLASLTDANGKEITRPYTPINGDHSNGFVELLVKHYPTGQFTPLLHALSPGDSVKLKGPITKLAYTPNMKREIGMIAGGTGITPMLQLIRAILNPEASVKDQTKISLLFANVSEKDILLKKELDDLAAAHPNQFQVHYTINKPETGNWAGRVGNVTEEMVSELMPKPSKDSLVVVCGPPKMVSLVSGGKGPNFTQGEVEGILKKKGFTSENVFKM